MARAVTRRQVLKLASLGAVGASLLACAPAAEPTPTTAAAPKATPAAPPTPTTAAAPKTTTPVAASKPAPAKAGRMTIWLSEGGEPARQHLAQQTVPAWQKEQPGVEVEVEFLNWQRYNERFLTAFASGTMADIFQAPPESTPELSRLKQARELDAFVKTAKNVKLEDHLKSAVDQFVFSGKTYCVPFRMQTRGWTYWKSHLEEKGVKPPKTWEDVTSLAQQLTIRKGDRITRPALSPWVGTITTQLFNESIWQAGGEMLTPDGTAAAFASPEGEQALTWMIKTWKHAYPNLEEDLGQSPVPHFTQERFSMAYGGQWHYDQVRQYAPEKIDDIGIVPEPVKPSGDKGKQITVNYASGWAISTQAKDPDLAFSFIDFFNQKDQVLAFMKVFGQFPTLTTLIEDPYYKNDPRLQSYWQLAQFSRATPAWPQVIELYNRLRDGLNEAAFGRMKPMEALQMVAKQWEPALKKEPGRP